LDSNHLSVLKSEGNVYVRQIVGFLGQPQYKEAQKGAEGKLGKLRMPLILLYFIIH
jgi:hypothetical protein